jgi:mRNA degradation ribonuclease J1/J2
MAVSHTHPDHIGNVELFPMTMLYVQKAEYEWPGANNAPTLASMQKISDTLTKEKAQLWINHDKAQRDSLKMSPEFYD